MFEWDERKAAANAAKHGVTFDDAVTVFVDANALDGPDLAHSAAEPRYLRLGAAADGRVLMVAYTIWRRANVETVRLISARCASRRERAAYRAQH
ncbi:BrnT family toxin [Luteitalea sp.]|uniref:BrnT family toxin n=1 Tax=Luteitalea sp. TaxID=2004800 RepID=UPI0025B8BF72|nr:BrnT family toxin [Luteitalea sp.]